MKIVFCFIVIWLRLGMNVLSFLLLFLLFCRVCCFLVRMMVRCWFCWKRYCGVILMFLIFGIVRCGCMSVLVSGKLYVNVCVRCCCVLMSGCNIGWMWVWLNMFWVIMRKCCVIMIVFLFLILIWWMFMLVVVLCWCVCVIMRRLLIVFVVFCVWMVRMLMFMLIWFCCCWCLVGWKKFCCFMNGVGKDVLLIFIVMLLFCFGMVVVCWLVSVFCCGLSRGRVILFSLVVMCSRLLRLGWRWCLRFWKVCLFWCRVCWWFCVFSWCWL